MYHIQHAHVGFREINFSAVWRRVANWFHKIILALQASREKEVARIFAQYQNDRTALIRALRKF